MPLIKDRLSTLVFSTCCIILFCPHVYAENSKPESEPNQINYTNDSYLYDPPFLFTDNEPDDNFTEPEPKNPSENESEHLIQQPNPDDTPSLITPETTATEAQSVPPFFSFLDEHQQAVSSYLQQYVQGVDNFFTDDSVFNEKTGSYLRLRLESLWIEREGMELDGGIRLRLKLPKTERKFKLIISNEVDEQKSTIERETGELVEQTEDQRGVYTGIERDFGKAEKWKFRPSLGVKLRFPLDWYLKLRAQKVVEFDNWLMQFNETLYTFVSSGFGSDSNLRWDRRLADDFLFRSDSFVRYTDELDYFEMSQTFSLIQTFSPKRAITYKAGVFGQSEEPTVHATAYLINFLYRNNIHKDYMFLDFQPQILFEKENDFKGRVELFIRLELFYRG